MIRPRNSCYFYQQSGQQYYVSQKRHQKSIQYPGKQAHGGGANLSNNIHLFMPTAERLVVFMNLAVTQYVFIAYIYWQV